MFKCNDCGAEFHETDMNRHQQKNEICPFCGGEDLYVKHRFQARRLCEAKIIYLDSSLCEECPKRFKCC